MEYSKNDMVTIAIEDMSETGEGIGKADGYTLFVKDAIIGDVAEVCIMKTKKRYGYARLKKVVTPSSFRVEPKCPYHRQCGGCQLQAMSYGKQLEYKQEKIRNHMIRIGGLDAEMVDSITEPIEGMWITDGETGPFRFRNKAQYPVGSDREGNPVTGFYAGRTHSIVVNTDCYLGAEGNREILDAILGYMRKCRVSAYDEKTGRGIVRHILIRTGFSSGEVMVCLVINGSGAEDDSTKGLKEPLKKKADECPANQYLPRQQVLIDTLKELRGIVSISVSLNRERTNVIMGKEVHTVWGKDTIRDTIQVRDAARDFALTGQEIVFEISPLSFYQVNPVQMEKLYGLVLEYAGLTGQETVWDLYCGIGTISLLLAGKAKQVYGVEAVPEAVRDARINADNNGIKNVRFFEGNAETVLPEQYEKEGVYADVLVVDPPRKGCDEVTLKTIVKMAPERVVYVSCDSATLARDLRVLCDGGYEVRRVRGVDQFGHSVHVETVVLLERKG